MIYNSLRQRGDLLETVDLIGQLPKGETLFVEFKARPPEPEQLARQIAAFANASGGVILVGVKDNGELVGCDTATLHHHLQVAIEHLNPSIHVGLEAIDHEGKQIGVIRIAPSEGIVTADGGAYVRSGAMLRAMTASEVAGKIEPLTNETSASLGAAIAHQTEIIEALREQVRVAHCFRSKIKDWLFSGMIGAIIGAIITALLF